MDSEVSILLTYRYWLTSWEHSLGVWLYADDDPAADGDENE